MSAVPLISDIRPTGRGFRSGDKILARVSVDLEGGQYQKLERSIKKFSGADVRVMIVNVQKVRMVLNRLDGSSKVLVEPSGIGRGGIELGVVNVDCSAINFESGDSLIISVPRHCSYLQRKVIWNKIVEWTGKDVEVMIL